MKLARQLPANLDAEEMVLGACLINEHALTTCLDLLRPDHFYRSSNAAIFAAMQKLAERREPIDVLTVTRQLDADHAHVADTFSETNATRVQTLAAIVPSSRNVAHHAKLVLDAWGKRRCISEFTNPMKGAWNGSSPRDVLYQVEQALQRLHTEIEDEGDSAVVTAFDAAKSAWERVNAARAVDGTVPPPYSFLDELMPGRLYILGGYAKDGKTDVGCQAAATACKAGIATGFVTIEMPQAYLVDRMISQFGVPYGPLQQGIVADAYRGVWENAVATIGNWPLGIYDNPAANVQDIARFARLGHYRFLVIDHLHRITYEDAPNPRLKLGLNVKQLATLARTLNIPVLLLAQLHRSTSYSDGFPRPTMQSFKETSTIEQEASALWAIFRKRDPDTGERTAESEFLVLADRYGEDGLHSLHFHGNYQRFDPIDWRSHA